MLQKNFFLIFCLFLWILIIFHPPAYAIIDPLSVPNNKYGIHIIDESDLESAAVLVNSSGGDFGYITMVVILDDQNIEKWSNIFKRLERLHLIPILRLATRAHGDYWEKPKREDMYSWQNFLSQLPWFTKNRYIIIFNEPNHSKEWGNSINPVEYARILKDYGKSLKEKSDDFFILPAGLDASAQNGKNTMDEVRFLQDMVSADADIFLSIDGWTSHAYPNPAFSGKPTDRGRGTLRTYQWEKDLFTSLGVRKDLPIFITETGWVHREGDVIRNDYNTADIVADFITVAGDTVWNDPEIVAVTPFVLNYQSIPFSHFSWQEMGSDRFYPQFDSYRSIPKLAGQPVFATPTSQIIPKENQENTLGFFHQMIEYFSSFFSTFSMRPAHTVSTLY